MDGPLTESQWKAKFAELPEARRERLRHWFATQALIIEEIGVEEDEWFGLIAWAFEHPGDHQHLFELDGKEQNGGEVVGTERRKAALEVIGAPPPPKVAATGEGLAKKVGSGSELQEELYQRFMNQRMNEIGRRPKAPKKV